MNEGIRVYLYEDLPEEYKSFGDDYAERVKWVAIVPYDYESHWIPWLQAPEFGVDVETFDLDDYVIYLGLIE